LLEKIEPGDCGFLNAVAGILDSGVAKRIHKFRFDMHINVKDQHIYLYNHHSGRRPLTMTDVTMRSS
jgi:hypothetical protein